MFAQLSTRERLALLVGGIVVLLTLTYVLGVAPYRESQARLKRQIATRTRQVVEVRKMRDEYRQIKRQNDELDKRLAKAEDFSLFSFVEALTTRVATKENLIFMRPQPGTTQDGIQEESVEIKLDKIRLDQLVRLLYEIENNDAFLQVRSLRVKTRFDDKTLLDVVMTIASFRRSA